MVTNDAWFGDSPGPYQHLEMSRTRAVEQGVPLVRVANTGISVVTDAYGRVLHSLPLNAEGVIDAALPQPAPSPGIFTRYGRLFYIALAIFSVAVLLPFRYRTPPADKNG
jgi:apolipoprotein N-acyltransferase